MGKHLTVEQRYTIFVLLQKDMSQSEIASYIGKSKSTISRELNRNCDQRDGGYCYLLAQKKCDGRHSSKAKHIRLTDQIKERIIESLNADLSPEQIVGRSKLEEIDCVSHETIYRLIWKDKASNGNLFRHLRNKGKRYKKRGCKDNRGIIPNRVDIDNRPKIVEKRERFGDFEADTIIGKNHKKALLTLTDRATGYGIIRKIETKDSETIATKIISSLSGLSNFIHTITSDNGLEFAQHEKVSEKLDVDFYFAKPYQAWVRGTNENFNRLVRQYFPKGTDFDTITIGDIKKVQNALNKRPRKRLNFYSPNEILKNLNIFSNVAFIT